MTNSEMRNQGLSNSDEEKDCDILAVLEIEMHTEINDLSMIVLKLIYFQPLLP